MKPLTFQRVRRAEERRRWRELVARYHPHGHRVPFGAHLRWLVEAVRPRPGVVACVQLSSAAWRLAARDRWIGWDDPTRRHRLQLIVTHSRFLVLPWIQVPHLASHLLGQLARLTPAAWQEAYGVRPVLLETLVEVGRPGTCYRAANWIALGPSAGRGRMDRFHERDGLAPKQIFVYPLVAHAREILRGERCVSPPPRPGPCCAPTARENRRLRHENQRLRDENARLTELLEQARRAGKRQAAPFSKGAPTAAPRRPGRRPGAAYGRAAQRGVPDHVDEVVTVPLPPACPHCGAAVEPLGVAPQYHAELPPVRPHVTRFDVAIGRCRHCRRRVHGRHPRQTSDALGAAASQLGPRALALAADLNKALGLSCGKVSRLFQTFFGIAVSRAGLCRALERVARAAAPTYDALAGWIRRSAPVVTPDETGWKVGGWLQWLWVFVTEPVTLYTIQPGRGFAEAAQILGEDFAGRLVRDGWAPYRRFQDATHQTCLGHLLRRCRELLETAQAGAARFPHAVKALVQDALTLRDRRGDLTPHGFAIARGRLEARADQLLAWQPTVEANRAFVAHLVRERDALFTFLYHPEVPATNWAAEQAIRPAVITRKVCGGNRTWRGAHTQQVLITVLRTSHQQGRDPYALLGTLLCAPTPRVALELLPSARSP